MEEFFHHFFVIQDCFHILQSLDGPKFLVEVILDHFNGNLSGHFNTECLGQINKSRVWPFFFWTAEFFFQSWGCIADSYTRRMDILQAVTKSWNAIWPLCPAFYEAVSDVCIGTISLTRLASAAIVLAATKVIAVAHRTSNFINISLSPRGHFCQKLTVLWMFLFIDEGVK